MAEVYLRTDGVDITDLPPVCLVCGQPATVHKKKQFSWTPLWARTIVLLALIFTKKQRVHTPLCDRHSTYWWLVPTVMVVGILGFVGLLFVAVAAAEAMKGQVGDVVGGVGALGFVLGIVAFLVLALVLNWSRIRVKEINSRYIHLINVSQEFVDALEAEEEDYRRAIDRDDASRGRRPKRLELADDDRIREQDDDKRYKR